MYAATGANRAQWWRLQPVVDALDLAAIAIEWRGGGVDGSDGPRATTLGALSVADESEHVG